MYIIRVHSGQGKPGKRTVFQKKSGKFVRKAQGKVREL